MAKVLYITANPKPEEQSASLTVGRAFLNAYRQAAPQDEVVELDLYRINNPFIDPDVFSAWGKLQHGQAFDKLSADERAKVGRINELTDQFVMADKYIIVTPLWNLSIPPKMKTYIDSICVAGKTFKYTPEGPVGLMKGKTAVHIQASGGVYSQPPINEMEHGHRYIRGILNFLGINPVEAIMVEGLDLDPSKRPEITSKAVEQAKEMAKGYAHQTTNV